MPCEPQTPTGRTSRTAQTIAMIARDARAPLTARKIAEVLGITIDHARKQLRLLCDEGLLVKEGEGEHATYRRREVVQ